MIGLYGMMHRYTDLSISCFKKHLVVYFKRKIFSVAHKVHKFQRITQLLKMHHDAYKAEQIFRKHQDIV